MSLKEQPWNPFVIYVNAFYAVQEAYDSARRNWERPAPGLDAFCRDANPFLWDAHSSAEEWVYQDFLARFTERFTESECTAAEGYEFARTWLATLEGDEFGTALVSSFQSVTDEHGFIEACEPIAHQLAARAMRLERTPQDEPEPVVVTPKKTPTPADIEAVIALLSHGDESFARDLRSRLATGEEDS